MSRVTQRPFGEPDERVPDGLAIGSVAIAKPAKPARDPSGGACRGWSSSITGWGSRCCASHRAGFPEPRAPSRNVPSIRPTIARNGERSAGETAEGSHNCGEIVPLIGSEPTKLDQRFDRAALDFAEETDFALLRAHRRGHTSLIASPGTAASMATQWSASGGRVTRSRSAGSIAGSGRGARMTRGLSWR
jgi:hypothetical protein